MLPYPVLFILLLFGALWAVSMGLLDKARAMMNAAVGFCRDRILSISFLLLVFFWVATVKAAGEVTADTCQAQKNGGLLSPSAPVSVVGIAIATLVVGFQVGTRWARSTGQQCQLGAHGALPADETSEEHQPPGTLTMSRGPTPTPQPQTPRHGVTGSHNAPDAPRPVRVARLQDGQLRDVSDELAKCQRKLQAAEKSNQELSGNLKDHEDHELALRNIISWWKSKVDTDAARADAKLKKVERERDAHAVSLQKKDLEAKKIAEEMSDAQQEYSVKMQVLEQRENFLVTRQQEVDNQTEVRLQELRESHGQLIGLMEAHHASEIEALRVEQERELQVAQQTIVNLEAKLADAEAERDRLHDGMQKCAVCKEYSPSDFEEDDNETDPQLQLAQQTIVNLEAKLADAEAERDRLHDGMQKCAVCKDYSPSDFEEDEEEAPESVIAKLEAKLADAESERDRLHDGMQKCAVCRDYSPSLFEDDDDQADSQLQIENLQGQLADLQEKNAQLQKENSRLASDNTALMTQVSTLDSMRARAHADKEKALAELDETRTLAEEVWQDRNAKIVAANELWEAHEALKEEHASAEPDGSHLESRVSHLESHLKSEVNLLRQEGQKVVDAFNALQVTNRDLESRARHSDTRNTHLESQVKSLKQEGQKVMNTNRDLESRVGYLESRNTHLESQNSHLESQNLALQNSPQEFGTNQLILVGTPDDMQISSDTSNEAGISGTMDFAMDVPVDTPMDFVTNIPMELARITSMEIVPISPIDTPMPMELPPITFQGLEPSTSMEIVPISPIDTPMPMELPPITFQGLEPSTSMEIVPVSPIDTPINSFDFALAGRENENLRETNESLGRENQRLEDEVRTMQTDYNRLCEQFEDLKSQNERLKSEVQGSAGMTVETDLDNVAMKKMVDDLQKEKEALEIQIKELNGQLQVLQNSRSTESQENQNCNGLMKQLEALRHKYNQLSHENWKLKTVNPSSIDDSNEASAAQTTIDAQEQSILDLRGQVTESDRAILDLKEEVRNANFTTSQLRMEIKGLESQKAAFEMMLQCDGTDKDCCRTKQRELDELKIALESDSKNRDCCRDKQRQINELEIALKCDGTNQDCCRTMREEIRNLKLAISTLKMNAADAEARHQMAHEADNEATTGHKELEEKLDQCQKALHQCKKERPDPKALKNCQRACEERELKNDSYKHLVTVMRRALIYCTDSLGDITDAYCNGPESAHSLKSLLKEESWAGEVEQAIKVWGANRKSGVLPLPSWNAPL